MNAITVRCLAERDPSGWEILCLDFDIASQGDTLEAAITNMREAIDLYLGRVAELPENERRRFLHRRAPLPLRLRFLWLALRGLFGGDDGNGQFVLPCHA